MLPLMRRWGKQRVCTIIGDGRKSKMPMAPGTQTKVEAGMRSSKFSSPWTYFGLTLAFSWVFTIPAAISGQSLAASPFLIVIYALGGLGPAFSAVTLTFLTMGKQGRRDYWQRIVDFRRIPLPWYGAIFLIVPALTAAAALADRILGGQGLELEAGARFLSQPLQVLPFALFILLFGPLPEELGWRGYVLDRLQDGRWAAPIEGWRALASSLVLGAVWALWHLPLFFIKGTYQHGLGVGSRSFWIFMFNLLVSSILFTWIYNNTRRSTLSAILFHFMQNFIGELFELSVQAELFYFLLTIFAAALVVVFWGPSRLTRWKGTAARSG
jgi:membrane protease YdiL (CAAX protease family)